MTRLEMSGCAGCGAPTPTSLRGRPRKWCSDRCRKRTLYSVPCVDCGALTEVGGDRCRVCHVAHSKRWTREALIAAIRRWANEHGRPPTAIDWNPTLARKYGRPQRGSDYPNTCTVQSEFGSWNAGIEAAGFTPREPWRPITRIAA